MTMIMFSRPVPCQGCGQRSKYLWDGLCGECTKAKEKAEAAAEQEMAVYRALMADPQYMENMRMAYESVRDPEMEAKAWSTWSKH